MFNISTPLPCKILKSVTRSDLISAVDDLLSSKEEQKQERLLTTFPSSESNIENNNENFIAETTEPAA